MAKKQQKPKVEGKDQPRAISLPKDAISRINLGQSFAEYDKLLLSYPDVFVKTPALQASLDPSWSKCFFVGRRGTGKTAITLYLERTRKTTIQIHPQAFVPSEIQIDIAELADTRRQPFRTLVYCFWRALQGEVVAEWVRRGLLNIDKMPTSLTRERNFIEEDNIDFRLIDAFATSFENSPNREKQWAKQKRRVQENSKEMDVLAEERQWEFLLLIDRIDEAWDGSDRAVIFLMALMHACVEISATVKAFRPILFLRENIFERVRQIDNEFARLETSVVSLDWTQELLLELIERRLNIPFSTKLPLRGPTWDYFFESAHGKSSREIVFEYCQERPRDVLTYCGFALEAAQSHKHDKVSIGDLQSARRRFSDSRLKDLGDEYSENYPQVQLVLSRFYGLGDEYTLRGMDDFVKKLLVDEEVKAACSSWLYRHTAPELFLELLYNIGFMGIKEGNNTHFRSLGARTATPPAISASVHGVVHPSYVDALNLRKYLISNLGENIKLRSSGMLAELTGTLDLTEFQYQLTSLDLELKTLSNGRAKAAEYESIVGQVIKLCFKNSLANVQEKSRTIDKCIIRDWIAANVAQNGFWEMIRQRYNATQVVWECKNYADLKADDFNQINYYLNRKSGSFGVICYRGNNNDHYYEHIKRIADDKNGMVLLLNDDDLSIFIRQTKNGKLKESHIREVYDRIVRAIS